MAAALTPEAAPNRRSLAFAVVLLAIVAVAVRWRTFGNPVIQIDEQWYRLVGGRMLDGALPYVDMFDRKPIGIFLIYAMGRLPGGDGVLACQIMALAAVVATAAVLFVIARRVAPPWAAFAGAALYILCLDMAEGEGGQSPVFYNFPVALAALLVLRATVEPDVTTIRRRGIWAMLLVGVALQIKYSVVFEGLFLGLALLSASWRARRSRAALAIDALCWVTAAALPTAIVVLTFAGIGHLHEWLLGNVTANLARQPELMELTRGRLRRVAGYALPILVAVPLRRWTYATPPPGPERAALRFVDAWTASSLLGIVLYGTWYDHYLLPLFAPLAAAAAPLGRSRTGRVYLALLLVAAIIVGQRNVTRHMRARGGEREVADLVRLSAGQPGCPLVFQSMPVLYDRLGACLPTTRSFPGHLNEAKEVGATGIDEVAEIGRIMRARPRRVVTLEPPLAEEYPPARAALYRVLRADYVAIYRRRLGKRRLLLLYALRGTEPPATISGRPPAPARRLIARAGR